MAGYLPTGFRYPDPSAIRQGSDSSNIVLGPADPTPTDPNFNDVILLVPFDGVNGTTDMPDLSPLRKTVTTFGGAKLSTANARFGSASLITNGTTDYIEFPYTPNISIPGNFTAEGFTYINAIGATRSVLGMAQVGSPNENMWLVEINAAGKLQLFIGGPSLGNTRIVGTDTVTALGWHHWALTRDAVLGMSLWLDGVLEGSYRGAGGGGFQAWDAILALNIVRIAAYVTPAEFFNGYNDEIRITNNVSRYVAPFTPPNAAFPTRGP